MNVVQHSKYVTVMFKHYRQINLAAAFPTRLNVRQAKTQISLHINAVRLKTLWILGYPQSAL